MGRSASELWRVEEKNASVSHCNQLLGRYRETDIKMQDQIRETVMQRAGILTM